MEVNEKNWNLTELFSKNSVFKRDQERLNIIIGFGFDLFSRAWKIFEARPSQLVDSRIVLPKIL